MNIEEEIKLISRRTEETLAIVVDHFKDTDERIEEIEYKIEEIESNHEALKKMLIKQLLTENNNRNSS
jgi:phosphohistidine phosphatase SixA|tara:strand:+ start:1149 stop:1352 length:204 start_codon:yes stop_codon:yes gene_type:complete